VLLGSKDQSRAKTMLVDAYEHYMAFLENLGAKLCVTWIKVMRAKHLPTLQF